MSEPVRRNVVLGLAVVCGCHVAISATTGEAPFDGAASLGTSYRLLLAADGALLFLALDGWRRPAWLGLAIAALFVAALSFRVLSLPLSILVAVELILRAREGTPSESGRFPLGLVGATLLLAIGVASHVSAHRAQSPAPARAVDRIPYELARGNLYRARAAALAGTKEESVPGAAYLALAEVDLRLGLPGKARKVLEKIVLRAEDPALKARAESLLHAIPEDTP